MKSRIIILIIFTVAVNGGLLFHSSKVWTQGKIEPLHRLKKLMQKRERKITIQRFGVDGASLKWAKTIAEINDGWSGVNGLRWKLVEPQPPKEGKHFYSWARIDRFVRTFQTTERRLQVNIRIFSDWAVEYISHKKVHDSTSGQKTGAFVRIKPKHLSDWMAFITAFVERYDADGYSDMPGLKYPITHIQIESEAANVWENIDGYTEALCVAYRAAKKASPNVKIMAAGFNMGDFFGLNYEEQQGILLNPRIQHKMSFLKAFFSKAETCFDILSLHLSRDYINIPSTVKWFRQQMETNGYQKPIWSDDTTSGPFLSGKLATAEDKTKLRLLEQGEVKTIQWFKQEQAKLLIKKAVIAFASGVDKIFISTDVDWPTYYMPIWRHMGLLDTYGNKKPAFYAFKIMVSKLDSFTKVERLDLSTGVFAYRFIKPSGKVYVLWSEQEKAVNLPVESKSINITEISGNIFEASPLGLSINTNPIFVEERSH